MARASSGAELDKMVQPLCKYERLDQCGKPPSVAILTKQRHIKWASGDDKHGNQLNEPL